MLKPSERIQIAMLHFFNLLLFRLSMSQGKRIEQEDPPITIGSALESLCFLGSLMYQSSNFSMYRHVS